MKKEENFTFGALPKYEAFPYKRNTHDAPPHPKELECVIAASMVSCGATIEDKRPPIHMMAIIDSSGSMAGEKCDLVQRSLEFIVRHLGPKDMLGLVEFGSKVRSLLDLVVMDEKGKQQAIHAIGNIRPRGATNLSGGILEGMKYIQEASISDDCTMVIFTDGYANEGILDPEELCRVINNFKLLETRYRFFCFGYGEDHDSQFLRKIQSCGSDGEYYYVSGPDHIPECFVDCLGSLLNVEAQNVSVKCIPIPWKDGSLATIKDVFHPKIKRESDGSVLIPWGDFYGQERKDLVILLDLNTLLEPTDKQPILKVIFSYFDSKTGFPSQSCKMVYVQRLDILSPKGPQPDVFMHHNRVICASALEKASEHAKTNPHLGMHELKEAMKFIQAHRLSGDSQADMLLSDLKDSKCLLRNGAHLYSLAQSHYKQRSSGLARSMYKKSRRQESWMLKESLNCGKK